MSARVSPDPDRKLPLDTFSAQHFVRHPLPVETPLARALRRTLDIAGGSAGLVLCAPVVLPLAALVRLIDGAPAFYVQDRVGRHRRPFRLYKLRTMVPGADRGDSPFSRGLDDPRITRLGRRLRRFRLDELPQFLNVLKGDMSLFGPRPEQPAVVQRLRRRLPFYDLRFAVKPGLTGWAQVHFRYGASERDAFEKLCYELYYLQNRSVWLDLQVLVRTVHTVLFRPGS